MWDSWYVWLKCSSGRKSHAPPPHQGINCRTRFRLDHSKLPWKKPLMVIGKWSQSSETGEIRIVHSAVCLTWLYWLREAEYFLIFRHGFGYDLPVSGAENATILNWLLKANYCRCTVFVSKKMREFKKKINRLVATLFYSLWAVESFESATKFQEKHPGLLKIWTRLPNVGCFTVVITLDHYLRSTADYSRLVYNLKRLPKVFKKRRFGSEL